jgi:large repetitive protein
MNKGFTLVILVLALFQAVLINAQINFGSEPLVGESLNNPTSLQFGPDGRLYVSQQNGTIYAYTIERDGSPPGNGIYTITATEIINIVKNSTPNHNDDGTLNTTQTRQITGIVVTGTAANPVLYVTSSDWRIAVGNDSGLDTNSGVVSRVSWNGFSWEKVDIVRGLPRCEENHSVNGMVLDDVNNILFVMVGGNTNKGAPGNNFAGTPEYWFSGSLITIDLNQINSIGVFTDSRTGTPFVYDLPTLNDPTRADINNTSPNFPYPPGHPLYNATIDLGDPFGGNNGLNQAIAEPGGPVQIYSPGYRNAYDIVLTQSGKLYTYDNGPNAGWGGVPLMRDGNDVLQGDLTSSPLPAGWYITNEFNESSSSKHGDPLHLIEGANYYGGHPVPIRAFPEKSGIYVYELVGGVWTEVDHRNFADLLAGVTGYFTPSFDISMFPDNPSVASYLANDPTKYLDINNASTNGICEYTASNFDGAMQGNLLAAGYDGVILRLVLNETGDAVVSKESIFSGFGTQPLDVIAQGDSDPFPGTVWVTTYGTDNIIVFEPADFGDCYQPDDPQYVGSEDYDNDGYTNDDEIANGTNHCSAGSTPNDNDGDFISDLLDDDDDNDGILDINDAFAIDAGNGLNTTIPVNYPFWNNDPGTGFFGVGFTGLMINNSTDYLDQFDPTNMAAGGAAGKVSVNNVPPGDAYLGSNNQEYAFQFGVNNGANPFTVHSKLEPPFFAVNGSPTTPIDNQSFGIFIGTGDQDNYLKIVFHANGGAGGIQVLLEENGAIGSDNIYGPTTTGNLLGASSVNLYLDCDPSTGTVQPFVSIDGGINIVTLGSPVSIPSSWFDPNDNQALAVGIISTSSGSGVPFGATWDFINVIEQSAATLSAVTSPVDFGQVITGTGLVSQELRVLNESGPSSGSIDITAVNFSGTHAGEFSYSGPLPITIGPGNTADIDLNFTPGAVGLKTANVELTHTGEGSPLIVPLQAEVLENLVVLYRVNAGGAAIPTIDSDMDWEADTGANPSPYLATTGQNTGAYNVTNFHSSVNLATTPTGIFLSERWDPSALPEMKYTFPATVSGLYEIRLYMANGFDGTSTPGARVFDIKIENEVVFDNVDLVVLFGHLTGGMLSHSMNITDGNIDIEFIHNIQNPLINGIEILGPGVGSGPPPIVIDPIPNQLNQEGDIADITVIASGGDPNENFTYSASGLPPGVQIEPTNGLISGTISAGAADNSPYNVTITASKPSSTPAEAMFTWTVTEFALPLTWTEKNENENYTARHECSFVQAGDRFYLFGGREQSQKLDIYNYNANTWSVGASAPQAFNHFQAVEYQGLVWVIGAFKTNDFPNEPPADNIYMYDPANNQWIQGPEIPVARRRGSAGLAVYNNKFYVVAGNTIGHNGGYVSWFDEYDPQTNTWTPLADAPRPRDHFHVAVHGDKLYVVSGRLSGGDGGTFAPLVPEVDVYNFSTGVWSTLPVGSNLPTPRAAASVANFQGEIYVMGGEGNGIAYVTTEALDPNDNTWETKANMNFPRHGTQAIVSGNGIHITAGSPQQGGGNQKNWEYYGEDNPTGIPSDASALSAPIEVTFGANSSDIITIQNVNGNQGIFITSMTITGTDAADFSFVSGNLTNFLLPVSASHQIGIAFNSEILGKTAVLEINYGASSVITINLLSGDVQTATVNGSINIPSACDGKTVVIEIYDQGTVNLVYSQNTTVNGSGNFSVSGAAPGTFDIFLKMDGFLKKGLYGQTLEPGSNSLNFGSLLAGDINNDNVVSGLDLSQLIAAYNSQPGDPNYNPSANFNCSPAVDGIDLSALIGNYNTQGDEPGTQ